jgi:hypothetical protein
MYEIKTEKELENFLKKLTETTVSNAKNALSEDSYRNKFNSKHSEDIKKLIGEQEEEEEAIEDEEAEDDEESDEVEDEEGDEEDEEVESEPAKDKKSKNPATDKAREYEDYTDDFSASYDDIKDAINILRAGRSLKDETISQELNDYYSVLDEDERSVLLIYLREISKILTGAIDGEEAQDPSNAKTYFNIEKIMDGEGEESKASIQKEKRPEKPAEPRVTQQKPIDAEDTTPPIRVNESQDFSKIKKIIGNK